jgi:hypothetical protein
MNKNLLLHSLLRRIFTFLPAVKLLPLHLNGSYSYIIPSYSDFQIPRNFNITLF